MFLTAIRSLFLVIVSLCVAVPVVAEELPAAGEVVAIHGDAYLVRLEPGLAVSVGSLLDVYRRLPDRRGSAAYRDQANWWQLGSLKLVSVGNGHGIAVVAAAPSHLPPDGLDESGVPVDRVQLGDRLRTSGVVAERPVRVRVAFARADLFAPQDFELPERGEALLREWLRGLKGMKGPIEVQVHAHLPELGVELPDADRRLSALRDSPFGPAPGTSVTPAEGLWEAAPQPVNVPEGRELLVVGEGGAKDTWHYMDPLTLAQRQGARIAGALASRLDLERSVIQVTVVPRPMTLSDTSTPGYDFSGDQIRILAQAIDWSEPPPKKKKIKKKIKEPEPRKRRRRLLEQKPAEVSWNLGAEVLPHS
tara:strand:+ start:4495 stop:5583 length:1089 start_codon:yes stop_codon:yes gene_type:complete